LALDAALSLLAKTPNAKRKSKPRTTQLKLAGIATIQSEPVAEAQTVALSLAVSDAGAE
jgi:ribonuclease-3